MAETEPRPRPAPGEDKDQPPVKKPADKSFFTPEELRLQDEGLKKIHNNPVIRKRLADFLQEGKKPESPKDPPYSGEDWHADQ